MPEETQDLSLFPLNVVLFPGMKLPLHIFEPRYRLMIGRCLEHDQDFGVLTARSTPGPGGVTTAYAVGTLARITHVDRLQDGRMNIMTTGVERFRVLQLMQTEPYIIARTDGRLFRAAHEIDPAYADALETAVSAGVEIHAWQAEVSPEGIRLAHPVRRLK